VALSASKSPVNCIAPETGELVESGVGVGVAVGVGEGVGVEVDVGVGVGV
jgi:hypothetical protein